jgi:transketolase N-terminal domain/subunit
MLEAFQGFVDQVTQAESLEELAEAFGDTELEASGDRFEQVCVALQGVADDNGIDVDLDCGGE